MDPGSVGCAARSAEPGEGDTFSTARPHVGGAATLRRTGALSTFPQRLLLPLCLRTYRATGGGHVEVPVRPRRALRGAADRPAGGVVPSGDPGADRRADRGRRRRRLTLITTDLEVSARLAIEVQVTEPGIALVPARLLGDTVKSLSDAPVEFETDQSQARSAAPRTRARCGCCRPRTSRGCRSPAAPSIDGRGRRVRARRSARSARGASRDEARPVLTGVLLEVSREGVVHGGDRLVPARGPRPRRDRRRRGEGDRARACAHRGRPRGLGRREGDRSSSSSTNRRCRSRSAS